MTEDKSHSGVPLTFSLEPLASFDPNQVIVSTVEKVDGRYGRFGGRCFLLKNVLTEDECQYLILQMTSGGEVEPVRYQKDYRQNDRCVYESKELAELLYSRVEAVLGGLAVVVDSEDGSKQRLRFGTEGEECTSAAEVSGAADAAGAETWANDVAVECPCELQLGLAHAGVWEPVGLNECFRFCRYSPGGFFRAHCDGRFERSDDEMSLFTCMFYLDDVVSGGATNFLEIDRVLDEDQHNAPAKAEHIVARVAPERGNCLLFFQPGLMHEGEELRAGTKHILRSDVMFRRDPSTKVQLTLQQRKAWDLVQQAVKMESEGDPDKEAWKLYSRAFKLDPRLEKMF